MTGLMYTTKREWATPEANTPDQTGSYGHDDVRAETVGSRNGIPTIDRLRNTANEDTAIYMMEMRRRLHLTQVAMAEELGVNPSTVASWEHGNSRPPRGLTAGQLRILAQQVNMPEPPEGGPGWTPMGPRFAAGLADRFLELFGDR